MRTVYVEAKVRLVIQQDDAVETSDVMDELDYNFASQTEGADIVDTDILEWEITDSK